MVHIIVNPEKIIKNFNFTSNQKRKNERKLRNKVNALKMIKKIKDAVHKIRYASNFSFPQSLSNNFGSRNIDLDFDSIDNFICSIEDDNLLQERKMQHQLDFVEQPDDVFSFDIESQNTSEIKGTNNTSLKKEIMTSITSHFDKELMMILNFDFNLSFDKMKNFEFYFVHNNSENIIKNLQQNYTSVASKNEISLLRFMRKKGEKNASHENLEFQEIFSPQQKFKLNEETDIKIRTQEILSTHANKFRNKKLRQSKHKQFFQNMIKSEEKVMGTSKKIGKRSKWICFACMKQSKIIT